MSIDHKMLALEQEVRSREKAFNKAIKQVQRASFHQREECLADLGYAAQRYSDALRDIRLELEHRRDV